MRPVKPYIISCKRFTDLDDYAVSTHAPRVDAGWALRRDRAVRPGFPDLTCGPSYVAMPFEVPS